jgi:hypothetical protein
MAAASDSYRLFSCALPECHSQARLCRKCDRGNWYCSRDCSATARRRCLRRAGAKYQRTRRGREKHKVRQQLHLVRKEKMTHQGPLNSFDSTSSTQQAPARSARVASVLPAAKEEAHVDDDNVSLESPAGPVQARKEWRCTLCGRPCGAYARLGFLRRGLPRTQRSPRLRC